MVKLPIPPNNRLVPPNHRVVHPNHRVVPPNHRVNFGADVNRMDVTTHHSYHHNEVSHEFIPEMDDKHSQPQIVYKHIYVTTPEVPKTTEEPRKKKKKKIHDTSEDTWMDYLNPFSCDNEYDDYEYTYYLGSGEEQTKKKTKVKPKKKKKKLIVKLVIAAALLFAAKCIITQLYYYFPTFFPTTGRDELYDEDDDQLYQDGIELDRVGDYGKAQEIARKYRTVFYPNFDETKIATSGNFRRNVRKSSRKNLRK